MIFGDFFRHGRGWHFEDILGAFWEHFGSPLATFWLPLGSVGAPLVPFVVPFAPWWHPFRSLRPLVVPFGFRFAPFGHVGSILDGFCSTFQSFSCLAITASIPSFFFLNYFKRAERASERSELRAKLFVESATRGSHCRFLPRMARQTFQIIDVNPCSREGLLLTRFPFTC